MAQQMQKMQYIKTYTVPKHAENIKHKKYVKMQNMKNIKRILKWKK